MEAGEQPRFVFSLKSLKDNENLVPASPPSALEKVTDRSPEKRLDSDSNNSISSQGSSPWLQHSAKLQKTLTKLSSKTLPPKYFHSGNLSQKQNRGRLLSDEEDEKKRRRFA